MNSRRKIFKSLAYAWVVPLLIHAMSSSGISAVPSEYCSTPPFMSNTVAPNVLIVLDNSGSMNDWAYSAAYDPTRYVAGDSVKKGYYGYFEPGKTYQYNGTEWNAYTGTPPLTVDTNHPTATGDFLNWATMRRIDAARKLLIGGKATPRSPNPGATVALYGETAPSPTWDFAKTDAGGRMSPFPASSYSFIMRADNLYVTPNYTVSDPSPRVPKTNYSTTWSYYGQSTQYRTVDEKNINDDQDYLYITSGTASQLFGYTAFTASEIAGTIRSLTVRFRAKKTSNGTSRVKGSIVVGGTEYQHSNYSNLGTSWNTYQFTWTVNPKRYDACVSAGDPDPTTCAAWQQADLTDSLSAYYVDAFGVYNVTNASSSLYPKVTWVELTVSLAAPSGGPYKIKVDWKGEDWAYQQGIIPNLGDDARFGLAFYNSGGGLEYGSSNGRYDGGHVANIVNFGQPTNMITTINNMVPDTWTPLGETLFEMVRYFRQDAPYYSGNSPADFSVGTETANDPFYFAYPSGDPRPSQYVPCAKSFILLLTDGESTMDRNIPTTATGVPSGKNLRDYDGDGKDSGSYPSQGSDYLDDVALWARTTDVRPGTCTTDRSTWTFPCLPGKQNIVTYSVFMFGTGSQLLKDAAINGGFEDLNGNNLPDCSTIPQECYRDTSGPDGEPDGVLDPAYDLPLTYFEGDDGYALEKSIMDAITSILRRAASGTAVSVLTTSSRGVGSMLQAYFHPARQEGTREVTWTGYVQNLWLDPFDNLREDTTKDFQLKLDNDRVIKLYFDTLNSETMVATFTTDADGNSDASSPGTLASCQPAERRQFMNINYLWEGGRKLALRLPSTRSIFTSKKSILGTADGTTDITTAITTLDSTPDPEQPSFDTGMSDTPLKAALNSDATYTANNIIRYIRGACLETGSGLVDQDEACGNTANSTYRDRRLTVEDDSGNDVIKVWKLGDVITSTPKVFSDQPLNAYNRVYDDGTYDDYIATAEYRKRTSTISSIGFIGANDGMLHAIRVGYLKEQDGSLASGIKALFKNFFTSGDTSASSNHDQIGEEVWAYIPYNAFPYLKYLADPTYCHIYYNDLTVNLVDASIAAPSGCTAADATTCIKGTDSWKTILIGGMRFGGACNGGLSPAGPPSGTPADVGFSSFYALDITDPENPVPMWEFTARDLGYATTYPAIVRSGEKNLNGRWYVVIGSGSKQLPKSGQDIDRSTTGYIYILDLKTGALVKKIDLGHYAIVGDILAVDADRDYKSEKIYFGTAYKDTTWKGKLMSIAIPDQDLTSAWTPAVTTLFTGDYPFTASPDATLDENRKTWVFIGSGKYYSSVDQTDTSQQVFLGLKDDPDTITYPTTTADLDNRTNTTTTGTVNGTIQECIFDTSANDFAKKTMVTSIVRSSAAVPPSAVGWYLNLAASPTGERVISRPLAIGGLVDFLSYKPNEDACAAGGDSYLYSLGYTNGVAPDSIAIRHPDVTGGVTSGNVTVAKGIKLGPGAPPVGEAIVIPPVKDSDTQKLKKKIQVATGVVVEAENKSTYKLGNRVIHWLKK